jgi:hypothetical protein
VAWNLRGVNGAVAQPFIKGSLWHVHIVNDSWMTNHCIPNYDDSDMPTAVANSLYNCNNTEQLVRFYYASLFSPVKSTLITAINRGYLKGFPGLTAQCAHHHITINNATDKEHMDQTQQGQRSTHPTLPATAPPTTDDDPNSVLQEPGNMKTNLVYMFFYNITGLPFTDQIGCFPVTSNQGHAYLIIFYVYDANFITSIPIKNPTKEELLRAYQLAYKY